MGRLSPDSRFVGSLWRQIVRGRKPLAVASVALLCTQAAPPLVSSCLSSYRRSLIPFDRETWLNNQNRIRYVDDLIWNRIKRGDSREKIAELLGEHELADSGCSEDSCSVAYRFGVMDVNFEGYLWIHYGAEGVERVWADRFEIGLDPDIPDRDFDQGEWLRNGYPATTGKRTEYLRDLFRRVLVRRGLPDAHETSTMKNGAEDSYLVAERYKSVATLTDHADALRLIVNYDAWDRVTGLDMR